MEREQANINYKNTRSSAYTIFSNKIHAALAFHWFGSSESVARISQDGDFYRICITIIIFFNLLDSFNDYIIRAFDLAWEFVFSMRRKSAFFSLEQIFTYFDVIWRKMTWCRGEGNRLFLCIPSFVGEIDDVSWRAASISFHPFNPLFSCEITRCWQLCLPYLLSVITVTIQTWRQWCPFKEQRRVFTPLLLRNCIIISDNGGASWAMPTRSWISGRPWCNWRQRLR